jgi:CheY-like chemotaxis protein
VKTKNLLHTELYEWQVPRLAYVASKEMVERHLMVSSLKGLYHSVKCFDASDEVIEAFDLEIPDLLVVDYLLPPFGGLRLLEIVRHRLVGGDVPDVIFCYAPELDENELFRVRKSFEAVVLPHRLIESGFYFRVVADEFVRLLKKRQGVLARA